MGCTTCSGNPNTWCTQCMPAEDTWVAPVDKLPDVFMGDRDHMYLLPNGDLFILSPDRTRWIKVNGQGGGVTYDDTKVINRLKALEGKTDNFISSVNVSRNGNKVKLTYTLVDGTIKEVEFEDKDTVALAYDDTALKARVDELEKVKYKDKDTTVYPFVGYELVEATKPFRVGTIDSAFHTYKYPSSNKPMTEPLIESVLEFDFVLYEKNSGTGKTLTRSGAQFNITKVGRKFDELYNEQTYALTNNTTLLIKLSTVWKDTDNKFRFDLNMTLIYKERDGDFVREYNHTITPDEIESREEAHISVQVDGVEKGYSKLTLSNVFIGMSNFGYRVYKQVGDNAYTKLEAINE